MKLEDFLWMKVPDPGYSRIRVTQIDRIRPDPDPDPDPQHWLIVLDPSIL